MELPADIEKLTRELDWNLLRTFMVVVHEGGVTKGANRLRLRQPSVSQALKRLEDRLEVQLIERSPSTFRVTPAGQHLYRECIEIYGTISRAITAGRNIDDELTGTVTIASFSRIESDLFEQLLSRFHSLHRKVAFDIEIMPSKRVRRTVLEKGASFGICLIDEKVPQLNYDVFYRCYFSFYCGPTHPLYGQSNLKIRDLRGHDSVSFKTEQLWDALRPVALMRAHHKLDDRVIGFTSHLGEAIRMIVAGLGYGPLPVHVAEAYVKEGKLWRLPPYENSLEIDVQMITNKGARLSRAEQAFVDFVLEELAQNPLTNRTYS